MNWFPVGIFEIKLVTFSVKQNPCLTDAEIILSKCTEALYRYYIISEVLYVLVKSAYG